MQLKVRYFLLFIFKILQDQFVGRSICDGDTRVESTGVLADMSGVSKPFPQRTGVANYNKYTPAYAGV